MSTFHPGYLASKYAKAKTSEARAAIKSEYLAKKEKKGMFTPRSPGKCHASIDATPAAPKEGASVAEQLRAIINVLSRDIDYNNDIGTVTSKLQERAGSDNHKVMQLYYKLLDVWEKQHVGQRLNAGEFMQELLKTSFAEARLKNKASVTLELQHAKVVAPMKKAVAEKKSNGGMFPPPATAHAAYSIAPPAPRDEVDPILETELKRKVDDAKANIEQMLLFAELEGTHEYIHAQKEMAAEMSLDDQLVFWNKLYDRIVSHDDVMNFGDLAYARTLQTEEENRKSFKIRQQILDDEQPTPDDVSAWMCDYGHLKAQ